MYSTMITTRFFFFNDTATTEIYTLSLHDALPICEGFKTFEERDIVLHVNDNLTFDADRKSTRLNSSQISYAVFCLKKKNNSLRSISPSCGAISLLSERRVRYGLISYSGYDASCIC